MITALVRQQAFNAGVAGYANGNRAPIGDAIVYNLIFVDGNDFKAVCRAYTAGGDAAADQAAAAVLAAT